MGASARASETFEKKMELAGSKRSSEREVPQLVDEEPVAESLLTEDQQLCAHAALSGWTAEEHHGAAERRDEPHARSSLESLGEALLPWVQAMWPAEALVLGMQSTWPMAFHSAV
mmetsp:Transcript_61978/g.147843  ORF Transcript_61978/g.147843 Transcript_61978/m.147843 type:complete len:115 (+) Transcript_61978:67-411(+)|eukprot:CAMPEP_0178399696 /NCGR_PEP_ID=MMETSP0689_2-20121128/15410_1 /TAXON_ID=160604 /ORGANISM="Amphidinium massartii, Strain CS-259" /LENGTH=114 /DNA_ID=CAMNT_0020020475 /DNA_START=73 /DNA_END=417 /DNA_ORIENTATION=+